MFIAKSLAGLRLARVCLVREWETHPLLQVVLPQGWGGGWRSNQRYEMRFVRPWTSELVLQQLLLSRSFQKAEQKPTMIAEKHLYHRP